ncbi:MAG: type IX secretion system sortase PorU [Bacteroidia bacterium]|nr:type IX secretion system sortase PorU [Bacteroidia bacterium]
MKFSIPCTLVLLFLQLTIKSQESGLHTSRIIKSNSSDTAILKIELRNAAYDLEKNRLPFYTIYNATGYSYYSVPSISVKAVITVKEPHAAVIRKNYQGYLKSDFYSEQMPSLSRDQNLNRYKLFPFRLGKSGEIEELVSYDINWQNFADPQARPAADPFASSSVLATGNWYKIAVTQTGIHKLTRSALSAMGINTNGLEVKKIRIYGNGGAMIPEKNSDFRYDDLVENSIQVIDVGNDGYFDNSDYILFYATGTTKWKKTGKIARKGIIYTATKSLYCDSSYYFVNVDLGDGKRILNKSSLSQAPDFTSNSYDYYAFHEENIVNFGKSGREFFGEYFDFNNSYTFSWRDGDYLTNDTIVSQTVLAGSYSQNSYYSTSGNGMNHQLMTTYISSSQYARWADVGQSFGWAINTNPNEISLTVARQTPKSFGWLDKITVNARRALKISNRQFCFRDQRVTGVGKTCNFSINNASGTKFNLWNVSDPLNPYAQDYNNNGSSIDFIASTDSLNEYCIAPESDYYTPTFVGKVQNQNLHSLNSLIDFIIVSHPLLLKESEYIGQFHKKHEGLNYVVINTEQIYNEFGSGKQEPAAIRDFIRMIYQRSKAQGSATKYVLLMGDGSYMNKNRSLLNNSNLIPTYQSIESLDPLSCVTTDDFYGLMDPGEGYKAESSGIMDIGVGRFPCRNVDEVKGIIAKIENYYRVDQNFSINNSETSNSANGSVMGDWRTWTLFLGDDEDGALHMWQSDSLTRLMTALRPEYNVDKILLDSYQRFSTPGGFRYPDAAEDFVKRLRKGTFIFNYTGHGGEVGLTAERIIDVDIINKLDNFNKLPLFITATCEFSRYDDPARTSAGEFCLLNPNGGAIAMYTTCRVAFAGSNFTLNTVMLQNLFNPLPNGKMPCLGDAIRMTKADPQIGQQSYNANFHLLGDPAMTLAYPRNKVFTSKINNADVNGNSSDTLSALAKITVQGFVADPSGNKKTDFNGVVYPTVFDKEANVVCLANTEDSKIAVSDPLPGFPQNTKLVPFEFKSQKNILYRGKAQVTNGDFSFTFLVPKDISYAIGPGKISYYATNGITDGSGVYTQVKVGGDPKATYPDNQGPQATIFLNEKNFVSGGITDQNPVFYADLIDSSGINTLGTGFGHDISIILDENSSKPILLNDYYEANLNSYQSGRVRYPLSNISEGNHRLTFKAWDIQNNSSTSYLDFIVANNEELVLERVLNYPNPFTTRTKFLFEHNQSCNPLKVTVQIYTVSGKLVKTILKSVSCENYRQEGIEWDGKDDYGDKLGRGVYVYKLAILDVNNKKAEKIEKLVILN